MLGALGKASRAWEQLSLDFAARKSKRDHTRTRHLLAGMDDANHHDEKRKSVLGPSAHPAHLPIAEADPTVTGVFRRRNLVSRRMRVTQTWLWRPVKSSLCAD